MSRWRAVRNDTSFVILDSMTEPTLNAESLCTQVGNDTSFVILDSIQDPS